MKDISDIIDRIMSGVRLNARGEPDWHEFLSVISAVSGADQVNLRLSDGFSLVCQSENTGALEAVHSHVITSGHPEFETYIKVILSWRQIGPHLSQELECAVRIAMRLAVSLYEQCKSEDVLTAVAQDLGFISVALLNKGEVLNSTPALLKWIDKGILKLSQKKLSLVADPSWIRKSLLSLSEPSENQEGGIAYEVFTIENGEFNTPVIMHCFLKGENNPASLTGEALFRLLVCENNNELDSDAFNHWLQGSDSEAQIAACFSKGFTAKQVSEETGFSQHTIYSYVKRLYARFDIQSQAQLTQKAIQNIPLRSTHDAKAS